MFGDDTNAGMELNERFKSFSDLTEKFYNRNLLKDEADVKRNSEILENWTSLIKTYKDNPEDYYREHLSFSPYAQEILKHKYGFEKENFGRLFDMNKKIEVDITFNDIKEEVSVLTGPSSGQEVRRPWFKQVKKKKKNRTENSKIKV